MQPYDSKVNPTTTSDLISVVMPCYNSEKYIREAIDSVLNQTYPSIELIIIDDGSTDNSKEILSNYHDRVTVLEQSNQGPYPARNLGLQHAQGVFIAFLDADDWWDKSFLETMHATLVSSGALLTYCGWQNMGEHARNSEPYIPPAYEEQDPVAAFLKSCPWPIHAALVQRSVLDAVQGFSERCFSSMDYDIWLRILTHTKNIMRVPTVLAYYRWHGSSQISATKWKQVVNAVKVRREFITNYPHMVNHLPTEILHELVDGQLLKEAYQAYWKRDLANAQRLFRAAILCNAWHLNDLKYILLALLPTKLFQRLVGLNDKSQQRVG